MLWKSTEPDPDPRYLFTTDLIPLDPVGGSDAAAVVKAILGAGGRVQVDEGHHVQLLQQISWV